MQKKAFTLRIHEMVDQVGSASLSLRQWMIVNSMLHYLFVLTFCTKTLSSQVLRFQFFKFYFSPKCYLSISLNSREMWWEMSSMSDVFISHKILPISEFVSKIGFIEFSYLCWHCVIKWLNWFSCILFQRSSEEQWTHGQEIRRSVWVEA